MILAAESRCTGNTTCPRVTFSFSNPNPDLRVERSYSVPATLLTTDFPLEKQII
jgi:hypothetical protein